jgi:putative ABC transport system permease protein
MDVGDVTGVLVQPLSSAQADDYGPTLSLLGAAVAMILTIGVVNIATLLFARGTLRGAEFAVRSAIGAGRVRLVRQLIIEGAVLALAAAVVGVLLAWVSLDSVVALVPLSLPPNALPSINTAVLGAAAVLSLILAVAFSLTPAIRLTAASARSLLDTAGRRQGSAFSRRGGQLLVTVEVAIALMLVAASGLLLRSLGRTLSADVGIQTDRFLIVPVEPVEASPQVSRTYYPALLERLRQLPEVLAAGAIDDMAFRGARSNSTLDGPSGVILVAHHQVLPGYFETTGARLVTGRLPVVADREHAEPIAVIDETVATQIFWKTPAIGRDLVFRDGRRARVIGVIGNIAYAGPLTRRSRRGEIYTLPAPDSNGLLSIVLRPRDGHNISASRVREAAESVGPRVLVGDVSTGTQWLGETVTTARSRTLLLGLLGGFGLLLTLVGIASTVAFAVARRTREIGVRLAFGAAPTQVVRQMVGDAARPVALGLVAGMAGAWYASRLIASFLFQTTPHDVATFAAVVIIVGLAAGLAAWVPARRAARVDPVTALRAE